MELDFDKDEKLELVQRRLVEINADLDEKYDADPKEVEKVASKTKTHHISKVRGVSL